MGRGTPGPDAGAARGEPGLLRAARAYFFFAFFAGALRARLGALGFEGAAVPEDGADDTAKYCVARRSPVFSSSYPR